VVQKIVSILLQEKQQDYCQPPANKILCKSIRGDGMLRVKKQLHRLAFILILAFIGLVIPYKQAEAAVKTFSDIKGHWANKSILEMNAYGIVQGYPGDVFKPNENIEFQQVVAMIMNAQGLKGEAEKADLTGLSFSEGTWAKGYLALAVQKNMLTRDGLPKLNPKRPATRLEVASLFCLALGFEPDYAQLDFLDAEQIDKNYRGYVGAIVKRGIMVGLPGNVFAPDTKITRAQMCVILSRLFDENWISPSPPMVRLTGRITGLDAEKRIVEIRNISGQNSVFIPEDCLLFNGNNLVGLDSLNKGLRIKLILDSSGQVCFGDFLSDYGSARSTEEGFLISLSTVGQVYSLSLETETGEKKQFEVYSDARLIKRGDEITAAGLRTDVFLQVSLDENNKIFEIEIHEPEKISGALLQIDASQLAVNIKGSKQVYTINNNVQVTRNTIRPMLLADLKPGDYVNLTIINDKVFQIDCLPDVVAGLSGMVTKVTAEYIRIIVGNQENRYDLDEQVEISKDGSNMKLGKLKRGDYITFALANQKVISIEILNETEGEFTGTVLYFSTGGNPSITVKISGGLELDFDLDKDITIYRYGDRINAEDILPGASILVEVDKGKAKKIDILDDLNITLDGILVNINEEGNRLTLDIGTRKISYNLATDLIVLNENGQKTSLTNLNEERIEATLENGIVVKIEEV